MYTNIQEYKGFNIQEQSINGRFYISAKDFSYPNTTFNDNGYATLNNAKGAITKYLKTQEYVNNAVDSEAFPQEDNNKHLFGETECVSLAAAMASGKAIRDNAAKYQSRNKREGKYIGKHDGKHARYFEQEQVLDDPIHKPIVLQN